MMILGDYLMRPIAEKDLQMILEWRNSDRIHSMMLTDHQITWEEHRKWFYHIEKHTPKRNFVFEYKEEAIGYIGYTDYDAITKKCCPGAYLGKIDVAPIDAGLYLAYMSIEYAFEKLYVDEVETFVFGTNKKALKINQFIGYKQYETGPTYCVKNGEKQEIILLALHREDWLKKKVELSTIV